MVQLELAPDVEERLQKAAEARGLRPEVYAAQLIHSAVSVLREKHLSREEMKRFLDGMAVHSDKLPCCRTTRTPVRASMRTTIDAAGSLAD